MKDDLDVGEVRVSFESSSRREGYVYRNEE